jgi:hypothetical protein
MERLEADTVAFTEFQSEELVENSMNPESFGNLDYE